MTAHRSLRRPQHRARAASVSVLFAACALPMVACFGLALDFGVWALSNATMSVAANVAAMTAAKVAVNAQLAGDPMLLPKAPLPASNSS